MVTNMADKPKKFVYVEPDDYIPKELYDKYFKDDEDEQADEAEEQEEEESDE